MRIFKHKTNISFLKYQRTALFSSALACIAVLVGIAVFGFNFGVDFSGGTLVEVQFSEAVLDQSIREAGTQGGLADFQVQSIGAREDNTFLLRVGGTTQLTDAHAKQVEAALRQQAEVKSFYADLGNGLINLRTAEKINSAAVSQAANTSEVAVKEVRELGESPNGGFDYQVVFSGMAEKVQVALRAGMADKKFEIRRVDYVGPQVGKQLRNKGIAALIYATLSIIVYVAFRFDFKFGPGALVSMVHDVLVTAGYYLVTQREFNLTAIAALLTVVGYSINDTIVIYDRIREEMVRFKGKSFAEIVNLSINATLSRTILTSGVTALSLIGLLIFGVGEIFDFAMAMLVGIFVATYSSIFVASPVTLWCEKYWGKDKKTATG
ncbi:MAG: protein translocase subunit SecF [Proteobacteria bacterium]|nr:protein translocase subunit SecF [Cystobacterineae bacterium]MCL2259504.1 protein translocase subunit SecF [Cystobacterineae bacterium]MCL2314024.1 protein translocase subunit SecF [Pseudomonadota bacterium]